MDIAGDNYEMASLPTTPLTAEQYLRIERLAKTRSEFHNGQMFAMAGGSINHSLLAGSAGALLDRHAPSGCRVFNSDLRIHVPLSVLYTYADCGVVGGEPQLFGDQKDCLHPDL